MNMNKRSSLTRLVVTTFVAVITVTMARAEVRLPAIFSDQMVMQREVNVPVWGWADPGEKVTVTFGAQTKSAVADASGKWMVKLDAMPASSDARELVVAGKSTKVKVAGAVVGEVWLASGQSNMDSPLFAAHNAAEVLPKANDVQLRFFKITKKTAAEPQTDCKGKWEPTTPAAAKNFSAVAYFFAQEIRRTQKCPVAVIQGAWGGTDIETWISLAGLKQSPALTNPLSRWDKALAEYAKIQANPKLVADYESELKSWMAEVYPVHNAAVKQWNADKSAGKEVGPKPQPSKPEPSNPDPMGMPSPSRRPSTPSVNFNGMVAPVAPYAMRGVIWYQGENNGARGLEYRELFPRLIEDWRQRWQAAGGTAGEFPFLFVQLPCNGKDTTPVAEQGWPWLREAQLMTLKVPRTAMAITIDVGDPNDVHPADKLDVGQRLALAARKLAYGEKLIASGPLFQSFKIEGAKIRVNFTEVGGGLKPGEQPWRARGVQPFPTDKLIGFFVAGEDRAWVEADAKLEGNSVLVSSSQVAKPVAVRYGWANSPRCNLYNKEGLPASPFRTDDWPK
jgi:sialate O-acetylesterase